jgi:diguanylate cyclase (GGDEF)-like protein/PAS domain S-box-containing protein
MLLRGMPDAIVALYDLDLRCLMLEGPMLRRGGFDPRDYVGRPIKETLPPEQYEQLEPLIRAGLAGESCSAEWTSIVSGITYEVEVAPQRSADGSIAGAFAVARDVGERNARIRALAASERMLAEAQAIAHVGSWTWDAAADTATWSDEMYRIFGRDPSDEPLTGAEFVACLHPDDRRDAPDHPGNADAARTFDGDYRIVTDAGEERILHVRGRLEGEGHYAGTVQDVTQLRATERALSYSAQFFRAALEQAPIGIAIVSPEGRWLTVNREVCELTGYSEPELLAMSFQDITHPDDLDVDLAQKSALLSDELRNYANEKRYIRKDGSVVWVQLSASLIRDERGEPVHFVTHIQDITSERQAHQALAKSERRYQSIATNVPGMVYRFTFSGSGEPRVLFASSGCNEIYGITPEQLMADPRLALDRIHPDDQSAWKETVTASAAQLSRWTWNGRHLASDGSVRYLHAVAQPSLEDDGTVVWDGVVSDVTDVREAERARDEALEHFEAAFDRAPIGMGVASTAGRIERVNEALSWITGYSADELRSMTTIALVHPDDLEQVDRECEALQRGEDAVTYTHRLEHAAGHVIWVQVSLTMLRDATGAALHTLVQMIDVSEQRVYEDELQHMAEHDPLTSLLNRRGFEAALGAHLGRCQRYGAGGALLMLDLDGFKAVNDTLGHAAGDEVIKSAAEALVTRLRQSDVIARLGGDEFAVLLPTQTRDEAEAVAQALLETIRTSATPGPGGQAGLVSASIGVALVLDGQLDAEVLVSNADVAMYASKAAGKGRYTVYSTDGTVTSAS